MNDGELILLPGLEGSGTFFEPFLREIPRSYSTRVIAYPPDEVLTYKQLLAFIEEQLPAGPPRVVLGESFAGPLALWYAAAHPDVVRAVVLVATFVRCPVPRWLARLATPAVVRRLTARPMLRRALLNGVEDEQLLGLAVEAAAKAKPRVLAGRIQELRRLDCTEALRQCPAPILYLQAERDRLVRRGSLRFIKRTRPDVQVRTLCTPHLLLQIAPAEAWREIESSLCEWSGNSPAPM